MALRSGEVFGWAIVLVAIGQVLGWLGVNWFGSALNHSMRAELALLKADRLPDIPGKGEFVGFATPRFRSALDPHEDVGLLYFMPDKLAYLGERYQLDIPRATVKKISRKPNIHTLLALGGWISIEGENAGKPFQVLLEPRERSTGVGNRREARKLLERLRAWHVN